MCLLGFYIFNGTFNVDGNDYGYNYGEGSLLTILSYMLDENCFVAIELNLLN